MSDPQLAGFHYSVLTDPESQWKVHELSYRDAKSPGRTVIARIVPAGGSNLVSLEVDGTEMLRTPPKISQAAGVGYGIPILYPTPNRVRDSRFMFDGRTFQFKRNERSNFIHGLVNRAEWKSDPPVMRSDGVSLKTYIDFDQKSPNFSLFPILNRLTMTYALATDGILMSFTVENRDGRPLPFGFLPNVTWKRKDSCPPASCRASRAHLSTCASPHRWGT
jgi:aldose 1-epimerase